MSTTLDAGVFNALGEANRFRIVELLQGGPRAVGEIVETLGLRQPQVSKHLRTLDTAGIVSAAYVNRRRIYRLEPQRFEEIASWVHSFEQLWAARLHSLDRYLATLEHERPTDAPDR